MKGKIFFMNFVAYILPLILVLGLFIFERLGKTDTFTCWIKKTPHTNFNMYLGLITFYFPLYICLIYASCVLFVLWRKLKKIKTLDTYTTINFLKNFNIGLFICYIVGSFYRVL